MNFKSIGPLSPIIYDRLQPKVDKRTKDSSPDRDPGQGHSGGRQKQETYTEEDLQKALEYLQQHPGIQKSQLKVQLEKSEQVYVFLIFDPKGILVRRMSVQQAIEASRAATIDTEDRRGGLLNRSS